MIKTHNSHRQQDQGVTGSDFVKSNTNVKNKPKLPINRDASVKVGLKYAQLDGK